MEWRVLMSWAIIINLMEMMTHTEFIDLKLQVSATVLLGKRSQFNGKLPIKKYLVCIIYCTFFISSILHLKVKLKWIFLCLICTQNNYAMPQIMKSAGPGWTNLSTYKFIGLKPVCDLTAVTESLNVFKASNYWHVS